MRLTAVVSSRYMTYMVPADTLDARSDTQPPGEGAPARGPLVDPYGRHIDYIRVSVTDRCDFRCVYCMAEDMAFLPRRDLLSLEELDRLCGAFIARGTRKIRLTGGEPLVRRDLMRLIRSLSRHLDDGALEELTLTTNGSQLDRFADDLAAAGVRRINVSLDSLDAASFKAITRRGDLATVLKGIDVAQRAGLAIKVNAVALKGVNDHEIMPMMEWAHGRGMDFTLIEVMPMGEIGEHRADQYLPLSRVRADLADHYTLHDLAYRTGGPARYVRVEETGGRLGFITPMTHNFCEDCNRVRLTVTGAPEPGETTDVTDRPASTGASPTPPRSAVPACSRASSARRPRSPAPWRSTRRSSARPWTRTSTYRAPACASSRSAPTSSWSSMR